jgi:hypothetical protein
MPPLFQPAKQAQSAVNVINDDMRKMGVQKNESQKLQLS